MLGTLKVEIEDPHGDFLKKLLFRTQLSSIDPDRVQSGGGLKFEDPQGKFPRNLQTRARLNSIAVG